MKGFKWKERGRTNREPQYNTWLRRRPNTFKRTDDVEFTTITGPRTQILFQSKHRGA